MSDYGTVLSILLIFLAFLYLAEVRLGMSSGMYDSELGLSSACHGVWRLSQGQFFGRVMPLHCMAGGIFLMGLHGVLGAAMILCAVVMFSIPGSSGD